MKRKEPIPEITPLPSPTAVLVLKTESRTLYASLEDNAAAKTLTDKLRPTVIALKAQGSECGYLCALPFALPRCDAQINVHPGDILLCDGGLEICASERSGLFTRIARFGNTCAEKLAEAFGTGGNVRLSLEWSE